MTREQAALSLGVAVKDIAGVEDGAHGTVVTLRARGQRLIRGDGVYGWGDHPRARGLPRYEPPAPEPPARAAQEAAAEEAETTSDEPAAQKEGRPGKPAPRRSTRPRRAREG